jgi:hypothetical protein
VHPRQNLPIQGHSGGVLDSPVNPSSLLHLYQFVETNYWIVRKMMVKYVIDHRLCSKISNRNWRRVSLGDGLLLNELIENILAKAGSLYDCLNADYPFLGEGHEEKK